MSVPTPDVRPRSSRSGKRGALCGLLAAAALAGAPLPARTEADPAAASPVVVPLDMPETPAPYPVRFFRLDPAVADTTYNLLVVPVRFPEDPVLGGGGRAGIAEALNGSGGLSLRAVYAAATGGRLTVESVLAPGVVADHPRTYYTVEGDGNLGFGLDPAAYPHNARRLVEEVTETLMAAVDFRRFDNTGDGIADGLLLLNSGPPAVEGGSDPITPDILAAHAFTLEAPVERGGALVFPYAVASTRDAVGPWAHEVGHLLGLTDLYVANSFCPGPGVGEWSLMATGSNVAAGADPAGLDAFSRQLLGFEARPAAPEPVPLADGEFLRVFRPGAAAGPRYFLVERRTGEDGLSLPAPAWVVYLVDESAGDNRSCPLPPESYRPLVEVRAVVCAGSPCAITLDDDTVPDLRDRDGTATGLILDFSGDTVAVRHAGAPAARLVRVGMTAPRDAGGPVQDVLLTIRNLDPVNAAAGILELAAAPGICLADTMRGLSLAPGETVVESVTARLEPCPGVVGTGGDSLVVTVSSADRSASRVNVVPAPWGRVGLSGGVDARYRATNLAAPRLAPWTLADTTWRVDALAPFADGEVASPWFTVPADARLVLDHAWDLTALSPDAALDGVQVRLRRPLVPDVAVEPELGWGYTAERKTGNALAGAAVLSGTGSRVHVVPLDAYAGDVACIVLRAAGDVDADGGAWTPSRLDVAPAPGLSFSLVQDGDDPSRLDAVTAAPGTTAAVLTLYAGPGVTTPVAGVRSLPWEGLAETPLGRPDAGSRRFTLVWSTAAGTDAVEAAFDLPPGGGGPHFLGRPHPNPLRLGFRQEWPITIDEGDPLGTYTCRVADAAGRIHAVRRVAVSVPGIRRVFWNGVGDDGRNLPAGMYFLQVRRPDGTTNARKIVVLP